ncbi:uncharacterized protein LOC144578706 [Callithrix jacchus]
MTRRGLPHRGSAGEPRLGMGTEGDKSSPAKGWAGIECPSGTNRAGRKHRLPFTDGSGLRCLVPRTNALRVWAGGLLPFSPRRPQSCQPLGLCPLMLAYPFEPRRGGPEPAQPEETAFPAQRPTLSYKPRGPQPTPAKPEGFSFLFY